MKIVVLGGGSAKPIPRDDKCEQCALKDPRDRRWPSALLIDGKFLIDCPPMILELLKSIKINPSDIKKVITTHNHEDAAGGLGNFKSLPTTPGVDLGVVAFSVPHGKSRAKGFLVNNEILYCSDYSDIRPALPYLKKTRVAFLDGSGWDKVFPSHQPMIDVIPVVKKFKNLRQIYFTHNGHTRIPHAKLEKMVQRLGDQRFHLAWHGMKINI